MRYEENSAILNQLEKLNSLLDISFRECFGVED